MMATWLEEHGVELVVLAGYMHLLTRAVSAPLPGPDRQRPPVAAAGVPRRARDRGCARGRRRDDRRDRALRRRGARHRPGDRAGGGAASSRARRSRSGSTRSSTGCCPKRREGAVPAPRADLRLRQGRRRRRSRAASRSSASSSSPRAGRPPFLEEHGLEVTRVEEVTAAPEMLGGRVKTLHPRDPRRHPRAPRASRRTRRRSPSTGSSRSTSSASTSIRSPRSRASPASTEEDDDRDDRRRRPVDAARRREELRARRGGLPTRAVRPRARASCATSGAVSLETRRRLAAEAFAVTAAYDAAIARWFARSEFFPDQLTLTFRKVTDLAYGENPHQTAAYYEEVGARRHLLSRVEQLGGKELSYNNLADLEGRAPHRARAERAGRGDRQAREPVRRRGRRDDRGGLGARARRRSGVGVRLRRRAQPAGAPPRSASGSPSTSSRCCSRRSSTTPRSRRCDAKQALRILARPRAPRRDARRARLQARARRPARAGARRGDREPATG